MNKGVGGVSPQLGAGVAELGYHTLSQTYHLDSMSTPRYTMEKLNSFQ